MQQLKVAPPPIASRTASAARKISIEPHEWVLPLVVGLIVAGFVYGTLVSLSLNPPPGKFFAWTIQYDQPYYMILARAALDMGNGLAYPNPFSLNTTQYCYSHLFILMTAWVHALSGIPLDITFQALGFVSAIAMFVALYFFVASIEPSKYLRNWMFLLAGAGASIGWAPAMLLFARHVLHHEPGVFDFHAATTSFLYEHGNWLDTTALNAMYPTEAFYHVLMFVSLALLVQRRYFWLALSAALMWWAHPFYGVELSLVICVAAGLRFLASADKPNLIRDSIAAAIPLATVIAAGFAYYMGFLGRLEEHRSIVQMWQSMAYKITPKYYPVHYHLFLLLPPVLVACSKSVRDWLFKTNEGQCLTAFVAGVLLLMNHNWIMQANQPAHFARGYLFVGLSLMTVMMLKQIPRVNLRAPLAAAAMLLVVLATIPDNIIVLSAIADRSNQNYWLPIGLKHFAQTLKSDHTNPVIAASPNHTYDNGQMYLMRQAKIRSFVSHNATPFFLDRQCQLMRFWSGNDPQFIERNHISYVIADAKQTRLMQEHNQLAKLQPIDSCDGYTFYKVKQ